MKWHHGLEVSKSLEYIRLKNFILRKIGFLIMSFIDRIYLEYGNGVEKTTDTSLVFSHGRVATPFMYSNFLMYYASEGYKVGSVQHTEVLNTGLSSKDDNKVFREKEVQVRAAELYQAIMRLDNDKIIMMGHSYGCATTIQAYHSLEPKIKNKVTHMILLDPWFFPLSNLTFKKTIECPVLILKN